MHSREDKHVRWQAQAGRHIVTRRFAMAIAMAVGFACPLQAENTLQRGNLVLHYNAVASTSLTPEVARRYAITRAPHRALLNISLQDLQADGRWRSIVARVSVEATNLDGQRQQLTVREIREGDAIYYLAEPRVADPDTLSFALSVLPEGATEAMTVRFQQEFFASNR